jgi:septum formation protein
MVKDLANSTHRVYTAHTIVFNSAKYPQGYRQEWVERAEVTFGDIPQNVLEFFAKEPEPYRHSGGYELTAMSGSFLKSINGSHSAVQGLDMHAVCVRIIDGGRHLGWWN